MSYADRVSNLFGKAAFTHVYPSKQTLEQDVTLDGLDDWGIEMAPPLPLAKAGVQRLLLTVSSSTSQMTSNLQRIYEGPEYEAVPDVVRVDTHMVHRFIEKYFTLNKLVDQFWDKLKYNIVLSNLLDDTMIASKNEQAMKELASRESYALEPRGLGYIKYDGSKLRISRKYKLLLPQTSLFALIFAIIHMLKRLVLQKRRRGCASQDLTLFKIILLYTSRYFQNSRLRIVLATTRIANLLNNFFMWNYKINKKLIINLLALKELTLFSFLKPASQPHSMSPSPPIDARSKQLYNLVDSSLSILIVNMKGLVLKLLPLMNGDVFEKYCNINTINFHMLMNRDEIYDVEYESIDINKYINILTAKLGQFNQLRKLLLCQFLSLNEIPKANFFVSRLHDEFTNGLSEFEAITYCDNSSKFRNLQVSLVQASSVLETLVSLFDGYEENFPQTKNNLQDEDILSSRLNFLQTQNNIDNSGQRDTNDLIHLDNLIDKISNLTANIKYFKKYHTSTAENFEEMNEKLNIFNQFYNDIDQIKELHQLNLNDLAFANDRTNMELLTSPTLSSSTSKCGSNRDSSDVPLKSFQNSSLKKRFSLPSNRHYSVFEGLSNSSATLSPMTNTSLSENQENSEKKYKKLSTGLLLGLLTVVEESKNGVSYDDNYLNLAPSPFETYNKATLDQLNSKRNRNSNNSTITQQNLNGVSSGFGLGIENNSTSRFSLYSVASNMSSAVSDLVSTTQITDYESGRGNPGTGDGMTKEQLKMKLEESFNRIYNLERENNDLRSTKSPTAEGQEIVNIPSSTGIVNHEDEFSAEGTVIEIQDDVTSQHTINQSGNMGFISELEKTLESATH